MSIVLQINNRAR